MNDIIQYHLCRPGVNCVYGGVGLSGEGVWLNNARYWRQQRRSMKLSPYHMPYTLGEGSYTHTQQQGKALCIQHMHAMWYTIQGLPLSGLAV